MEDAEEVKRIIKALVVTATCGITFMARRRGPFTIPPPIPRKLAAMPAKIEIDGMRREFFKFHSMSPL